ncbi:hypothetical protein BX666DRAFT_2000129 [Dichotomocladium elegans]|nr:hypothetical protein BX666DRAFT_2000129 [Dichotomocladium elegans]
MILRNFRSKRLDFSYLMPKKGKSGQKAPCGCYMVIDPMWQRWKENASQLRANETTALMEQGKASKPGCIEPNMFYGLVEDYPKKEGVDESQSKSKYEEQYKIIHSPQCILSRRVDDRATEFIPEALFKLVEDRTNEEVMESCKELINAMGSQVLTCQRQDCNQWDKRIIYRLEMVMKFPDLKDAKSQRVPIDEVIDRVHSRIPGMLRRLGITQFKIPSSTLDFTIEDVTRATILYLGIKRAVEFSRRIYEENALVIMGYNINVGHEVVTDITEIPTTLTSGFSSKTVLESTNAKRFIEKIVEPNSIFILAIAIDIILAAGIMILSKLGPILSMFTSRRMTAPYRESYLRMGTTMRWSINDVCLFHSGTARDDWMVCLRPTKKVNRSIFGFLVLACISSFLSVVIWVLPSSNQQIMNPDLLPPGEPLINIFGKSVCLFSLIVGIPWVFMTQFVQNNNDMSVLHRLRTTTTIHTIVNIALVSLLPALVFSNVEIRWVYIFLLEAVYFAQWLFGEIANNWCYESTSLLMIGVLGAVRLCNLTES